MTEFKRVLGYAAALAAALTLAGCSQPSPTPPAAPVAPSPAQAPSPVAPTQHQFNVYFDWNRAAITPEAQRVIERIVIGANRDPTVKVIMLVGKADLSGRDDYNVKLSHRRADAVRTAIVTGGIAPSRIVERWVGSREPPVPTAPGLREPRNRVVEVTFQ
jgi:outer membrane protein OmpA-like peptidoglycan-associated protein